MQKNRRKAAKKWVSKPENYQTAKRISAECNRAKRGVAVEKVSRLNGGGQRSLIAIRNEDGLLVGYISHLRSVVVRHSKYLKGRDGHSRATEDVFACLDTAKRVVGQGVPPNTGGSGFCGESCRDFFTRITGIQTQRRVA